MKYQNNQNNMITLRAKEELHKTGSFGSQKQGRRFSLCTVNFAIIADENQSFPDLVLICSWFAAILELICSRFAAILES